MVKKQKLETELVPEYIADFLEFVQMHDIINLRLPYSTELFCIENYESGNEWLGKACYGTSTITFSLEEDIIKTACGFDIGKDACIEELYNVISIQDKDEQSVIEATNPTVGDQYLVINDGTPFDNPTSEWSLNINSIATWTNLGWSFEAPTFEVILTSDAGDRKFRF